VIYITFGLWFYRTHLIGTNSTHIIIIMCRRRLALDRWIGTREVIFGTKPLKILLLFMAIILNIHTSAWDCNICIIKKALIFKADFHTFTMCFNRAVCLKRKSIELFKISHGYDIMWNSVTHLYSSEIWIWMYL